MAGPPVHPDRDDLPTAVPPAEVESLLCDLVRIPSHDDAPGGETKVAQCLADRLHGEGIACELNEVIDGRCNLLARLPGRGGGPTLLFQAHSDTVPAGGMADPFTPRVEAGRITGRGSCDVKGAMAAMAGTLIGFARGGRPLDGDLLLAVTVGEESYSPGAARLAEGGLRADYVIVGEPTMMQIGVAHKGVLRLEAHFAGRAAHASTPERGVNAIVHAARWIELIERKSRPAFRARRHPLLGSPTMNVGEIRGGTRAAIVAPECSVFLDRRLIPGETAEQAAAELDALIGELAADDPQVAGRVSVSDVFHGVYHGPFESSPDSPLAETLADGYRSEFGQPPRRCGLPYWTDAALLGGMPGVRAAAVCGPGDIAQAHADDEYLARDQLHAAGRIYARVAAALCGA